MKRSTPMRRTPLKSRGAPLARRAPINQKSSRPNTKPATVLQLAEGIGEAIARERVRGRSGGWCEIRTPWCQGRATNFSHRVAKGQGGPWTAANGLDSCGMGNVTGCHGYLHQHPIEARAKGWIVESTADPARTRVLMHSATLGHVWVLLDNGGGLRLAELGDAA